MASIGGGQARKDVKRSIQVVSSDVIVNTPKSKAKKKDFTVEEVEFLSNYLLETPPDEMVKAILEDESQPGDVFVQLLEECQHLIGAITKQRDATEKRFLQLKNSTPSSDTETVKQLQKQIETLSKENATLSKQLNRQKANHSDSALDLDELTRSATKIQATWKGKKDRDAFEKALVNHADGISVDPDHGAASQDDSPDSIMNRFCKALDGKGLTALAAFRACDENDNGLVTTMELWKFLEQLNLGIKRSDLSKLMALIDEDGNGSIQQKEFENTIKAYGGKLKRPSRNDTKEPGSSKQNSAKEDSDFISLVAAKIWSQMRFRGMTPEQVFRAVDIDASGVVTITELESFLTNIDLNLQKKEVFALMKSLDSNGNGTVEQNEFVSHLTRSVQQHWVAENSVVRQFVNHLLIRGMDVEKAFKKIDTNRNGVISFDELRTFCQVEIPDMMKEQMSNLMKDFDSNRNGTIERSEFIGLYTQVVTALKEANLMPTKQRTQLSTTGSALSSAFQRLKDQVKRSGMSLQELRDKYDKDLDGVLKSDELMSVLSSKPICMPAQEIKALLNHLDPDHDGFIHLDDFIDILVENLSVRLSDHTFSSEDQHYLALLKTWFTSRGLTAAQAFRMFDENQNGVVTIDELRRSIQKLCPEATYPQISAVMKALDKNLNGTVERYEFEEVMNLVPLAQAKKPLPRNVLSAGLTGPNPSKGVTKPVATDNTKSQEPLTAEECLNQFKAELKRKKISAPAAYRAANVQGPVTFELFEKAVKVLVPKLSREDVFTLFKVLDANKNGTIELVEFCRSVEPGSESRLAGPKVSVVKRVMDSMAKDDLSPEQAYQIVDQDFNGVVTVQELVNGLLKLLPDITRPESMELMKLMDTNQNGTIERDEFIAFFQKQGVKSTKPTTAKPNSVSAGSQQNTLPPVVSKVIKEMKKADLNAEQAYQIIDQDMNGVITVQELVNGLLKVIRDVTRAETMELMKLMDTNQNGTIEEKEFMTFFAQHGFKSTRPPTSSSASASAASSAAAATTVNGSGPVDYLALCRNKMKEEGVTASTAFDHADEARRGVLTVPQLTVAIKYLVPDFPMNQISRVMKALDSNGNGTVERSEFMDAFQEEGEEDIDMDDEDQVATRYEPAKTVAEALEQLKDLFTKNGSQRIATHRVMVKFNADGNSSVSRKEFLDGLDHLGLQLNKDIKRALLRIADTEGDGTVDFNSFMEFIEKYETSKQSTAVAKSADGELEIEPDQDDPYAAPGSQSSFQLHRKESKLGELGADLGDTVDSMASPRRSQSMKVQRELKPSDYFRDGCTTILTNEEAAIIRATQLLAELPEEDELFCDPDFGPTEDDEHGALSVYASGKARPNYPPVQKIVWLRPEEYTNKDCHFLVGDSSSNDVVQGQLGDCWFLGALSVLATRSKLLHNPSSKNPSRAVYPPVFHSFRKRGLYVFRFMKNCKWTWTVIDDKLPCFEKGRGGVPIFAKSKTDTETWVSLIEKAYAKLHNCYEALIKGSVDDALTDMTGFAAEKLSRKADAEFSLPKTDLWQRLVENRDHKTLMGCSRDDANVGVEQEVKLDGKPTGIVAGHAYSILDVVEIPAKKQKADHQSHRLLRLRNPWGQKEWNGKWSDSDKTRWTPELIQELNKAKKKKTDQFVDDGNDGTFMMCFSDWRRIFTNLFEAVDFPPKWSGSRFFSAWTKETSGGTPGGDSTPIAQANVNWAKNPQYRFKLKSPSKIFISLQQPDGRLARGANYPYKEATLPLLFTTVKLKDENERVAVFDAKRCIRDLGGVMRQHREVAISGTMEPGCYAIVPSTKVAGATGEFYLAVYYDCEKENMEWLEEGATVIEEEEGEDEGEESDDAEELNASDDEDENNEDY